LAPRVPKGSARSRNSVTGRVVDELMTDHASVYRRPRRSSPNIQTDPRRCASTLLKPCGTRGESESAAAIPALESTERTESKRRASQAALSRRGPELFATCPAGRPPTTCPVAGQSPRGSGREGVEQ